ncbi:MAG: class I SAM-dependent methyltransferase [Desulforhopalus sp.]|nr:class I SAM-dependent methyltransferase [Desulforhopalus sp.]
MNPPPSILVSSTINSVGILQKAADLAKKLGLPFVERVTEDLSDFVLAYTPEGLALLHASAGGKKTLHRLLFVDFVGGKNAYRLHKDCSIKQPLARAAGIKSGLRPEVLDGTAGLGADAFVLASLGCQVTMCERSPVIAALLADGLQRARENKGTIANITQRMRLMEGDAANYLHHCAENYSTVYLDPMYPHREDSALNRQSMRIIRALAGDDQDSGELLTLAVAHATNRVVVKRPRLAPPLTEDAPSHIISMKNSRFDIYLTFNSCRS